MGRKVSVRIMKPSFAIGKKPSNDLVLSRTNISREHCVISSRDGEFYLRDYQRDGVGWLSRLRDARLGALLADDMAGCAFAPVVVGARTRTIGDAGTAVA